MKKKRAIVALGGNALIKKGEKGNIHQQFANTRESLSGIIKLLIENYDVAITHGNGPQVGNELIRMERSSDMIPSHPLGVIDALTQGWIGYMIAQSLINRLKENNIDKEVVALVTQVLVDPNDPSIQKPSKPVGPFYKEEDLLKIKKFGWKIKADAGRGYRRVVPSPQPLGIIEKNAIISIIEKGNIVIAAGGGGIPVYYLKNGNLEGLDAVIDKDKASAVLGKEIEADLLFILTGIEFVMLNFGKPNQKPIKHLTVDEAEMHLKNNEFAEGSMKPKIQAAIDFIKNGGKRAIIADLNKAVEAIEGKSGTIIENNV